MLINEATIATAFRGFRALAADAVAAAPKHAERIAMRVTSTTTEETYHWLGSWPMMREWVGPRLVHKLKAHGYSIRNRKFESTVEIDRDTFADDKIGLHAPMVAQLGHAAAQHVEELVFGLLGDGFTELGYDGQPFFDTDHPVEDAATGATTLISNFGGGSGTAWYLLDTSQPIRPLILQWREELEFTALNRAEDESVFLNDKFLFGARARLNVGFGLWQLAYASKETLNATNYAAARAAMMGFRAAGGRKLGITPNLLVVPPALESAGRKLLNSELGTGGESNEWKGTAELLVSPWLS